MTDREKAIIMAYTGVATLVGEKIDEFYKYLAELYGRPVYTHELLWLDIKEKSKLDFVKLCQKEDYSQDNDLISRQAAIAAADRADYTGLAVEDVKKVTDEVVKEIKALPSAEQESCKYWDSESKFCALYRPSAQPEQRWIPVTERLPEDGAEVWVTTEILFDVTRARWHEDSNLWCHPYHSDCLLALRPIAWMPYIRPKPWKGENDG